MPEFLCFSGILTSAFQRVGSFWSISRLDCYGLCHGPSMECPQEIKSRRKRVRVQWKDSWGVWASHQARRRNLPICWVNRTLFKGFTGFPSSMERKSSCTYEAHLIVRVQKRHQKGLELWGWVKEPTGALWIFQSLWLSQGTMIQSSGLQFFLVLWMRVPLSWVVTHDRRSLCTPFQTFWNLSTD